MSSNFTRIRLRHNAEAVYIESGESTFYEALYKICEAAKRDLERAQQILHARADDFEVDIIRSPRNQERVRKVKP